MIGDDLALPRDILGRTPQMVAFTEAVQRMGLHVERGAVGSVTVGTGRPAWTMTVPEDAVEAGWQTCASLVMQHWSARCALIVVEFTQQVANRGLA